MKRQTKPSDHIFLGMVVITLEVIFTWYYYVKNKLRQNPGATPKKGSGISDEAFEEELAKSSAANGNGKIVDEPCDCDDLDDRPQDNLGEVEEPETPVPSLPEEPSPSDLAETDSPETDQH